MKKIYLAGPGVFRPDAGAWGQRLKAACLANGLEGLYPLDQSIPADIIGQVTQRYWIFANNCALIRLADAVMADLRAFRSPSEPDSGTAFEVGFAHALGKPIFLWLPDCAVGTEMHQRLESRECAESRLDAQGLIIEDFGAPLNLMLWEAAAGKSYQPEPEAAMAEMTQWLLQL